MYRIQIRWENFPPDLDPAERSGLRIRIRNPRVTYRGERGDCVPDQPGGSGRLGAGHEDRGRWRAAQGGLQHQQVPHHPR